MLVNPDSSKEAKVYLLLGGTRGIGSAACRQLHAEAPKVVIAAC